MNNFEKVKLTRELEIQKVRLENELAKINKSIEEHEKSCLHVGVNLGDCGFVFYPGTKGNRYRCLICGKELNAGDVFFELKYFVHAEDYLAQYDTEDDKQCDEKFDNIQTLAFGLLRENPNMSEEELATKLNSLIQESLSFKEGQDDTNLIKIQIKHKYRE